MNKQYWQDLASDFSSRVLELPEFETKGVLQAVSKKVGGKNKIAIDFGCGPGASTRMLSPYFKKIIGVDFASKLIEKARSLTKAKNVFYEVQDLESNQIPVPIGDVGFCVNVLLHKKSKIRDQIVKNVIGGIKKGGTVVFVVPAMESVIRAYQAVLKSQDRQGLPRKKSMKQLDRMAKDEIVSIAEGIVMVGNAPTKHYMQDELVQLMEDFGVEVSAVEKVEFPWTEEVENPSKWLGRHLPWDWLIAGKIK